VLVDKHYRGIARRGAIERHTSSARLLLGGRYVYKGRMSRALPATNVGYISVGVKDLAAARRLWVDELGLEVMVRRRGADAGLARLWGLRPEDIVDQLLLRTPGAETGWLHFVEFASPGESVRKDAATTDLGAKNLDVNCEDIQAKVAALKHQGHGFRSAIGEYRIDDIHACEVQMPGHDDLNIVFIEVLSRGFEVGYTEQGFAAVTSFVVIVPDIEKEADFYQTIFGQHEILRHRLAGPAIEMAAALPPGTVLDLRLLGSPDSLFGRMELIQYVGVEGDNRFERAVPPATGILGCGFFVASLQEFLERAVGQGANPQSLGETQTVFGAAQVCRLYSPAGLALEVMQLMGDRG
jgi:catechol 2,3-dioxygenase-like lactoylglutathione lyase family enzyme